MESIIVIVGFLGAGKTTLLRYLVERFMPPIQISVLDVKNWQKRNQHNELEANQVQV